jgi:CRISPR-associated protein Cas1
VRVACRDSFRRAKILDRIIPLIEDVLKAGGLEPPEEAPEGVDAAIPREEASGDDGHRN